MTLDKNGHVYFGYDTLYSVNYYGNLRWKKSLEGYTETPLTCDVNGNVYVVVRENSGNKALFSFNNKGEYNWKIGLTDNSSYNYPALGLNRIFIPSFKSSKIFCIK